MLLLQAAASGSILKCQQLLAAGCDLGEKDENGWTALRYAALGGVQNTNVQNTNVHNTNGSKYQRGPIKIPFESS